MAFVLSAQIVQMVTALMVNVQVNKKFAKYAFKNY